MMQGLFIVVVSSLLFGVTWGNLARGFGGGRPLRPRGHRRRHGGGRVRRATPTRPVSIGVVAGMILGALGGAMVPGELFPEPISTISMLTPHYWAIDGLRDLVFYGAGVTDILAQLAVLAGLRGRARRSRHVGPASLAHARLTARVQPPTDYSGSGSSSVTSRKS